VDRLTTAAVAEGLLKSGYGRYLLGLLDESG
jgi:hypothetical protein